MFFSLLRRSSATARARGCGATISAAKSVVQSPWWYAGNFDPAKNLPTKAMVRLAELGYDVVPCSSNCYSYPRAMELVVDFCRKTFKPEHVLGFQMAPWLEMNKVFEKRWFDSADQLASSRCKWHGCAG